MVTEPARLVCADCGEVLYVGHEPAWRARPDTADVTWARFWDYPDGGPAVQGQTVECSQCGPRKPSQIWYVADGKRQALEMA